MCSRLAAVASCLLSLMLASRASAEQRPEAGPNKPIAKSTVAQIEDALNPKFANTLVQPRPKVAQYDEATDSFKYIDSRTSQHSHVRPGGTLAYYGTRLTQFRFRGPAKMGGLYSDLDDYKEQIQAEPEKYQYRYGSHGLTGVR